MRRNMFHSILSVLLSLLLVMQGMCLPFAHAEEAGLPSFVLTEIRGASTQKTGGDSVPDAEGDAEREVGLLKRDFVLCEDKMCSITVAYDEKANIPADAELHVREVDGSKLEGLRATFRRVASVRDEDYVFQEAYLDISIVSFGLMVEPASAVEVTVQTNAIEPAQSDYAEAAFLLNDSSQDEGGSLDVCNLTDKKDTATKLSFSTQHLGTFALAVVAGRIHEWQQEDGKVTLLGPRREISFEIDEAKAPLLDDGMELRQCFSVKGDSGVSFGTTLWLTIEKGLPLTGDEQSSCDAREVPGGDNPSPIVCGHPLGGTVAYCVRDGALDRLLFDARSTEEPVPFDASNEQVLLAWDGRCGWVPAQKDADAVEATTARDALDTADDAIDVVQGGNEHREELAPKVSPSLRETDADKDAIEDETTDKTVDQAADEAMAEAQDDSVATSTSFVFRAIANSFTRAGPVTFVDENKNPLPGTVLEEVVRSYTGLADQSNDTNTVDMHSFVDKLDPAIADEYDFSRVYVILDKAADRQKDFRYVQIGDDRNINPNGSATTYRAYFYMESIDQNRSGQVYNGTWYTLNSGSTIDDINIEFYHVADASFFALDTRGNPVQGAEFTLYADSNCNEPFEYKHAVVTAESNKRGEVSFGKIPRGTYYMKETVIPEGYKKTTKVYAVVVDGETAISNVIHQDDDGSVIVNNAKRMTITKEWEDDGKNHEDYVARVSVLASDEDEHHFELSKANDWTYTLEDLDPNVSYEIEESDVVDGRGKSIKQDWTPDIVANVSEEHIEYPEASDFIKGKQYVIATPYGSGYNALAADTATGSVKLVAKGTTVTDGAITGDVTDDMVWDVTKVTKDGVITLQNMATGRYLDHDDAYRSIGFWFQNEEVPQFVRYIHDGDATKIYYRKNLNNTSTLWMYLGNKVDRFTNNQAYATKLSIYRKVDVKTYDITITNKSTTYPMKIQNLEYLTNEVLQGMEYKLYDDSSYNKDDPNASGTPLYDSLVADEDGFLRASNSSNTISLNAGAYYLVAADDGQGYEPLPQPIGFTVTQKGMISVQNVDGELPYYASGSTVTEGEGEDAVTYPLLKVLRCKYAAVEVMLNVEGSLADRTKAFEFTLTLPDGLDEQNGAIDGVPVVFNDKNATFTLAHGQVLRLEGVPSTESYVLTQAESQYDTRAEETEGLGRVSVAYKDGDTHMVVLSGFVGTLDNPAHVTITNALKSGAVLPTGVNDNAGVWGGVVTATLCMLGLLFVSRKRCMAS